MAARRGRRDGVAPPLSVGPGPDPGGGVRGSGWGSRSQASYGTVGAVSGGEQVLLHEEGDDSGFVSLSRLESCLRDKDLEMDELMLQDETLLETMHNYMDASLISLIEDFGGLGESRLSLEDQNEVSLLTALTEILDNADSENLSPFDSIPDSELLVSPRESSSLHKLLTLSRTPPERDLIASVDPLGSSTGSNKVEMSLTDPSWDFSAAPFLETSSPKLPTWRPPRARPRWGQSSPPLQRSDGEEEEEMAGFSGQVLTGELTNSVSNVPDFPMHLACPEEEDRMAAEMLVQPAGDESISSLSELVRAMHPYCLPNLTQLSALESELQEQPADLTLPEDCVVLEIVGQAATAGNKLEIPVVVRQIPPGPQPVLLDDALETSPALQLLMPQLETEPEAAMPKKALCPEKEVVSSLDSEEKLGPACVLESTEVTEPVAPKDPQSPPDSIMLSPQVARKGRRKKMKEQPAAGEEGGGRRLRSSSRGQSKVTSAVTSQAVNLQQAPQREVGPPRSRGKPRAWARAWAAALEKPSSEDSENSSGQASPAKEGLDLYDKLVDTIQVNSVSDQHSLADSAPADPVPLDSEAGPTTPDSVFADPSPVGPVLVDLASTDTKLVDSLPADSLLTEPVLANSAAEDPAMVVPVSDDLPPVAPVAAVPAPTDPVLSEPAPIEPVVVKSRPTDPRRAALSLASQLKAESSKPSEGFGHAIKVESGTSVTSQEAKPRPLSLSEYRRRRQQRQAEAQEKSSQPPAGKWPSLPETPTGLADIPCLVVPPAPVKKTGRQRSSELASEAPSPASPSPEPPISRPVVSAPTEQAPSQEIAQPARPPPPTLQSMHPPMSSALPFPPGGLGMTPMLPLPPNGHGVPSLPPPPLQPPSLPMSMGPVPPDPYTHYAPMPPWPCYPPVSPSGYPCLPPPPTVPLVSGTPGSYAVSPNCNVPWVPPPAPVPPYSSGCAYGPVGWGPGLQHPPFWPTVPPPPLPLPSVGRAVPSPAVEPSGSSADPLLPESVLPVPVAPPPTPSPAGQGAAQVDNTKVESKPVPASPPLKQKAPSPVQSPRGKTPPCPPAEGVTVEEPELETLKLETQDTTRPKEKPPSPVAKAVSKPTPRQSTVPKLPAVHPARLRKLSFLPNPRTQGPEDVVQAFISEIGIEASDLSSLLEQFEKSEAKKECPTPAPADNLAVGNSGVDTPQEKRPLDRLQAPELANVAGLTPPATPPHQLWKPLAAVSLLAKAKSPKSTAQEGTLKPEGVTEAKHPAAARLQEGAHGPSPVHVGSGDHDYCVRSRTPPKKMPALVIPEVGSRWNVKRHQDITIKPVLSLGPGTPMPPRTAASQEPLDHRTSSEQADPPAPCLAPSALLSPEASPCRNDTRTPPEPSATQPSVRCYRKACRSTSPPDQGWQGRRGRSRRSVSSGSNRTSEASSSSSSSSSSSRSRSRSLSPPHKRWRRSSCSSSGRSRRCSSSSSSSSSTSSSSSSSSRSRSRSPSPRQRSDRRHRYSSYHRSHDHYQRQRVLQKERAIEERRVVFIGKIPGRMTRSELKQRFSVFGEIEECTIHFRVQGDNYGFVTYRYAEEAFAAIESGHTLRQGDEQPFDLCFGGRRQFCKRSYSDLDSNREDFDPAPVKSKFDSLDFDTLLKKAQKNLRR